MPDALFQNDLPPGAPQYAAGPLANTRPTAAAVLASGQTPNTYFQPKDLPVLQPVVAAPASSSLGDLARGLLARATNGISSLFGGTPAVTPALVDTSNVASIANRTRTLENGLNDLELRSTGFRPPPTNAIIAARQAEIPAAQRKAIENIDENSALYQSRLATGK